MANDPDALTGQQTTRPRVSRLALVSFILSLPIFYFFTRDPATGIPEFLMPGKDMLIASSGIISILALVETAKSGGNLRGKLWAIAALVIAALAGLLTMGAGVN